MQLVLSTFCNGIDLLGRGFEETGGFCVVQSGDIIFGQDIRKQHFPKGKFNGVIGGTPCQDFSRARRTPPTGYGLEMIEQFKRVVIETGADWFLLENVPAVPDIEIHGYYVQRFDLNANECNIPQNRLRHFQWGHKQGYVLDIKRERALTNVSRCVTASEGNKTDKRTWSDFCALQGLPRDFDLTEFHQSAKYRAVGNAVNLNVARTIAAAVRETTEGGNARTFTDVSLCACGCGRILKGNQKTANDACRKRLSLKNIKNRELATVKAPGLVTRAGSQ